MIDIIKELESKKEGVDKVIERYIPREYNEESLDFTLGKPRYAYDKKALTEAITKPTWDFLDRGGKRWRPALFILLMEAMGGNPKEVMDFILIPEVIHNGTLVIDDIEDGSELRRGKPSAHLIHGVDLAINYGNTMYFTPLLAFIKNRGKISDEKLLRAYEIYAQEMINISHGQAMDIYWHKDTKNAKNVTEDQYLQMCAYKTGTLARMSAKIAALLSNAKDEDIEKIGKFSETIGVAFQIQDDILNLTATSGKNQFTKEYLGSDISEGKRTLLVIHTLNQANEKDKTRLKEILDMHTNKMELRKEAIDIIKKYNSIEYGKKRARELMEESWNEIDAILKPSEAKEKLHAFAKFLIDRDV